MGCGPSPTAAIGPKASTEHPPSFQSLPSHPGLVACLAGDLAPEESEPQAAHWGQAW